jgi:chromosome segregation ATPase
MANYDDIKANYDSIKEECDIIKFRLFKLTRRKDRYQSKVSDIQDSIFDETKNLNKCQNELAQVAAQLQAVVAAQPQEAAAAVCEPPQPDIGGKRRHTKRYKKSKKPKRRFTRSKIRV